MSHKITSFALALILFFAAIVVVSVEANTCSYNNKRSYGPPSKRNKDKDDKDKHCPCALAQASFSKNVTGITVYSQNECGSTTVTGFLTGLKNPCKNQYAFLIVDKCGNLLSNMTDSLNATIAEDGTTTFTAVVDSLNLNCDKDGILNAVCTPKTSKYSKRQSSPGSDMQINQNGGSYAQANVNQI